MATREIIFRGKRADDDKWIYGYYLEEYRKDKTKKSCIFSSWADGEKVFKHKEMVIPETVGQYTGLTDKNGNRIFEGDIVCTRFPKECEHAGNICSLGDIQFRDGMFGIEWTQWKNDTFWGLRRIDEDFHKEIEIIGNIYDSPELVEVGV